MMNLEKRLSSHVERFPKTLFALSWCRITEDDGSGDLLSQSQMHLFIGKTCLGLQRPITD
jgi:hypothetical protein